MNPRNWHPADLPLEECPEWMRPSHSRNPLPIETHPDEDDETYTEEDAELDRLEEEAALARTKAGITDRAAPGESPAGESLLAAAEARYQAYKAQVIAHEEHGGPAPALWRKSDPYEGLFRPFGGSLTPEDESPRWLLQGLLPLATVAVLAAPPKSGKTDLATALAYAVATGSPFVGRRTEPGAVLWVNGEETPAERAHLLAACPVLPDGTPAPLYESLFPVQIEDGDFKRAMRSWIDRTGAKLLVLDSLRTLTRLSLGSPRAARNLMIRLRDLASESGATVLVLHHTVKTDRAAPAPGGSHARFADSPALLSTAGLHLHMSVAPVTESPDERRVLLTAAGRGLHHGRTLLLRSPAPLDYRPDDGPAARPLAERVLALLAQRPVAEGEATAEAIARSLEAHPTAVRNALTALTRANLVAASGKRGRAVIYALEREDARPPKGPSVLKIRPVSRRLRPRSGSPISSERPHERPHETSPPQGGSSPQEGSRGRP